MTLDAWKTYYLKIWIISLKYWFISSLTFNIVSNTLLKSSIIFIKKIFGVYTNFRITKLFYNFSENCGYKSVKMFNSKGQHASIYRYMPQRLNVTKQKFYHNYTFYVQNNIYNFKDTIYKPSSKIYGQRLMCYSNWSKSEFNFDQWLVGFTDGDGTFNIYINPQETKVNFTFKIGQSLYNVKLLYLIKTKLGVGDINLKEGSFSAAYRLRNKTYILEKIIPIFDQHLLLTSKRYHYLQFKKSLLISLRKDLSQKEKITLIKEIKNKTLNMEPNTYISDVWNSLSAQKNNNINYINHVKSIVSKSWLIGFIEAEGSFYYVKKDKSRIVHGFEINQKLDCIVLTAIKDILHFSSTVQYKSKHNYYTINTTNSRSIENILSIFTTKNDKSCFLGAKNFEFKVWRRTYTKFKGNYIRLEKIRNWINILKNKHKI